MINCWIYHFILLYFLIDLIIFFPFIFQKHFYVWCQKQLDYNSSLLEKRDAHERTRASRWRAITYPRASAIAYHHAHWNSKCVPPVLTLTHRAITCDSFKFLAQKPRRSWVTIKNDSKSSFSAKFLHHCIFCSLPLIWYATWLCFY